MQPSRLRPVFNLIAVNKKFNRSAAVSSAVAANVEQNLKSWKEIPGPASWPIIKQLHHFLPGGSLHGLNGMEFQEYIYKEFGPIIRLEGMLGGPSLVYLFDAEASAQILHGENWMPLRPGLISLDYYRKIYSKSQDDPHDAPTGLITDHEEVWKKFRSTVNPIMLKPNTIKLYSKILDEVALDMIERLRTIRNDQKYIQNNFDAEMNLWSLESIGVVALGGRINCLDPDLPQDSPARRLIKIVHDVFTLAEKLDFRPSLWRYISTPTFKQAMSLYEEQKNVSKIFIGKAMEQLRSKGPRSDDEKGILEKLLEIDENVAVIMATDMLFAGVDTMHVIFGHEYLSLMEDQYIKPKEFIPERWIVEKGNPLYHGNAHPFAFSPFGFGVRSCIGRRIAELELETFLARVIENFQLEWSGPPLKTRATSLNYTVPPYSFVFKDIKNV